MDDIHLTKIGRVNVGQTVAGRMLDYGSIHATDIGRSFEGLDRIAHPNDICQVIETACMQRNPVAQRQKV